MARMARTTLVLALILSASPHVYAQDKPAASAADDRAARVAARAERGQKAFEEAQKRMQSKDPRERAAAANEMGKRGYRLRKKIAPLLMKALAEDPDGMVRAAAGRALGRLSSREAVPILVRALRDPVVDVRVVAAAALWRLPDAAAVPALLERLEDEAPSVREWSAMALGVTGDKRAVPALMKLTEDPERAARLEAVRALGRLRDASALPALEKFLSVDGRDAEELQEGVNAITNLKGSRKVNVLVALLSSTQDQDHQVRLLSALGQVGDALVIPRLRSHLNGGHRQVRAAAESAIAQVEKRIADAKAAAR